MALVILSATVPRRNIRYGLCRPESTHGAVVSPVPDDTLLYQVHVLIVTDANPREPSTPIGECLRFRSLVFGLFLLGTLHPVHDPALDHIQWVLVRIPFLPPLGLWIPLPGGLLPIASIVQVSTSGPHCLPGLVVFLVETIELGLGVQPRGQDQFRPRLDDDVPFPQFAGDRVGGFEDRPVLGHAPIISGNR
ncbi:unnamed protein product [Pseudo-nitzschia multistriata]|uniref:Uncharacterized protein n=1 Tax=Pseudo-nitzschia multistriata TaxID=183589 RepID=A0A448ZJR1_9STRA|nr:unnamed protein product [Pseudo-nitzschia multistriata]